MAELGLDMVAANRFISSLSKSLQALCHGCMEFDKGIEIGGYIYVSIDRGSKVDYVLNEMVQKNDNNSMKFISNSYLSKKDQQKPTRDEACSPVLELQSQPSLQPTNQRHSYQYPGSQYYRSGNPYSSQSRVLRGAQKRAWSGTDRLSRKHFRGGNKTISTHQAGITSSFPTISTTQASEDSKSSFRLPHIPGSKDSIDINSKDINIKQEMIPAQDNTDYSSTGFESDSINNSDNNEITTDFDCANIKRDPDCILNDESMGGDSSFKQTQNKQSSVDDSTSVSEGDQNMSSDMPSGSNQSQIDYENADLPVSFNYSGEADISTDGFDVIEIGDEDQDVQAMFGDNQGSLALDNYRDQEASNLNYTPGRFQETSNLFSANQLQTIRNNSFSVCNICQIQVPCPMLKQHMSEQHGDRMPFSCKFCGKGFLSRQGLKHHTVAHTGTKFACPVCDSKFMQKYYVKVHMQTVHKVNQCASCMQTFPIGKEYNQHITVCQPLLGVP